MIALDFRLFRQLESGPFKKKDNNKTLEYWSKSLWNDLAFKEFGISICDQKTWYIFI